MRSSNKKSIAIGPQISSMPSWNWVGADTAEELKKYYEVKIFGSSFVIPKTDYLMIIKHPLRKVSIQNIKKFKTKVFYCPIDFYHNPQELHQDRNFLSGCDGICLHCERWIPYFKKYNNNVHFVEHHGKFTLPNIQDFKEKGFVLWIGSFQYIPFLLNYAKFNALPYEIVICSDLKNERAKSNASKLCRELKISMDISSDYSSVNGIKSFIWSPETQQKLMMECKAAMDIKSVTHFSQGHKPPTKAQKYISSGIPFAVNKESYSYEYFSTRGLEIPEPNEIEKFFSQDYWHKIQEFAKSLRKKININTVGLEYRKIYEKS